MKTEILVYDTSLASYTPSKSESHKSKASVLALTNSGDFAVFQFQVEILNRSDLGCIDHGSCYAWLVLFINTADQCLQLPKRKASKLSYSGIRLPRQRYPCWKCMGRCRSVVCNCASSARFEAVCFHCMTVLLLPT
jgi:hypothetical protein